MSKKTVWRRAAESNMLICVSACPAIQEAATGFAHSFIGEPCLELLKFIEIFRPHEKTPWQLWWDKNAEGYTARVIALLSMEYIDE